jgi:ribonuclease HI
MQIVIPAEKEASKQVETSARETIKLYTDGSSHNDAILVGAAAVLYRKGRPSCMLKYHLGPASKHTVYEAELIGLLLGIHLIKTEKRSRTSCALGADNQAAIQALQSELTKPGQHIAAEFLKIASQIDKARGNRKYSLTVRWTAGHTGIAGNEKADVEAKAAAEGESSDKTDLPRYLRKPIKEVYQHLSRNITKY